MRTFKIAIAVLLAVIGLAQPSSAQQGLGFSFLERYLDSFREQAKIPGLSVAFVQNGTIVWSSGLGKVDVEANISARADTPYVVGDLSQTFGATLLLRKCVDQSYLELGDLVTRWVPEYLDPQANVGQLLTHTSPSGQFVYSPTRFEGLTGVIEECADQPYRQLLAEEIFRGLSMVGSVPSRTLASPTEGDHVLFSTATLAQYASVLRNLAQPYRLDQGRPVRSQAAITASSAANGAVSTVLDFAQFDLALRSGRLLASSTLQGAWTQTRVGGTQLPTGQGWFVQNYNNEPLIWHLGFIKDAYSSLVIKLPNRDLTLILMANSDGLGTQQALDTGDLTTSPVALLILRLLTQ